MNQQNIFASTNNDRCPRCDRKVDVKFDDGDIYEASCLCGFGEYSCGDDGGQFDYIYKEENPQRVLVVDNEGKQYLNFIRPTESIELLLQVTRDQGHQVYQMIEGTADEKKAMELLEAGKSTDYIFHYSAISVNDLAKYEKLVEYRADLLAQGAKSVAIEAEILKDGDTFYGYSEPLLYTDDGRRFEAVSIKGELRVQPVKEQPENDIEF